MMKNNLIITEAQKVELQKVLTKEEFEELLEDDDADFFSDLHLFMVGYMEGDDYRHTKQSYRIQQLYDEIFNQNESEE